MRKIVYLITMLLFASNIIAQDKLDSVEFDRGYLAGKGAAEENYEGNA